MTRPSTRITRMLRGSPTRLSSTPSSKKWRTATARSRICCSATSPSSNKDNAVAYGLDPSKYTDVLTKVTLDSATNPRPGFLTRAGFLSSYANYGATSPILRGSFVAIWLMSINVPAPDPSFALQTVDGTYLTQRAYVEALTQKNQPCKGCHENFNPIGFVF